MVWKTIKESPVSKKDIQQTALYGVYFIVALSGLAWIIRHFQYIN